MTDADLDKLEAHPTNDPTNPLHRLGEDLQEGRIKDLAVSADVDYALHEIARLQASARRNAGEIETLRAALKPFADAVDDYLPMTGDGWPIGDKETALTLGDLRRARAAHTGEG